MLRYYCSIEHFRTSAVVVSLYMSVPLYTRVFYRTCIGLMGKFLCLISQLKFNLINFYSEIGAKFNLVSDENNFDTIRK